MLSPYTSARTMFAIFRATAGHLHAVGVAAAAALVLVCGGANAQIQPLREHITFRGMTPGEFAVLPEWCYDSQGGPYGSPEGPEGLNRSPRAAQWVGAMGKDFWHLHHYCWALRDVYRTRLPDTNERERGFLLARAVSDLVYTIQHCQSTMPLMPEVYLYLGDVYLMQGNRDGAHRAYEQSRQLKPDYWPAYTRWADYLIGLRLWEAARPLLEEGLSHSPGSDEIKERLALIAKNTRKSGVVGGKK